MNVAKSLVMLSVLGLAAACFAQGYSDGPGMALGPAIERQPDKPLSVFRDCREFPEMVVIPLGTFISGFTEKEKLLENNNPNIPPGIQVTISKAFAIGKYELTIAEFRACIDDGVCQFRFGIKDVPTGVMGGMDTNAPPAIVNAIRGEKRGTPFDSLPMTALSVEDIKDYLAWISRKTGRVYRLPTRIEWSYAARAGMDNPYPWGDKPEYNKAFVAGMYDQDRYPLLEGNSIGGHRHNVGLLPPSAWGLHDMIGNVEEVVFDCRYQPQAPAPDIATISTANRNIRICQMGGSDAPVAHGPSIHTIADAPSTSTLSAFQHVGVRILSELSE